MSPWIWFSSGWVLAGLGVLLLWLVVLPMAAAQDWVGRRFPVKEATRTRWRRRVDAVSKAFIVVYVVVIAAIAFLAVLQQFDR